MPTDTSVNKFLSILSKDTELKQVSKVGAGEWAGPCPFCRKSGIPNGGRDRFHVMPSHDGTGDKWFCRQCSKKNEREEPYWQGPLQYLMKMHNISIFDARMKYENWSDGTPIEGTAARAAEQPISNSAPKIRPQVIPETLNRNSWRAKAASFVDECRNYLNSEEGEGMYRELCNRGLNESTIAKYRLGFNPETRYERPNEWGFSGNQAVYISAGLVIPWFMDGDVVAVNIRRFDEEPKYMVIRGSERSIFASDNLAGKQTALFVEGEFDCILADQEIGDLTGCVTLGPATGKFNLADHALKFIPLRKIIVAGDNDEAGRAGIRRIQHYFNSTVLLKIPALTPGGKDLTDYKISGGNIRRWFVYNCERRGICLPATSTPETLLIEENIDPTVSYITDDQAAIEAISQITAHNVAAIDTETYSSHDPLFVRGIKKRGDKPATDAFRNEIRLISVNVAGRSYVFDLLYITRGIVERLLEVLKNRYLIGHNIKFDIKSLCSHFGEEYLPSKVFDTMTAETLLWVANNIGRTDAAPVNLRDTLKNTLKIEISKDAQLSDWSYGPLSAAQINYAGRDTAHLLPLATRQIERLNTLIEGSLSEVTPDSLGLRNRVARIEFDFLPEVVRLELAGMPINPFIYGLIDRCHERIISFTAGFEAKYGFKVTQTQKLATLLSERLGTTIEKTSYSILCFYESDELVKEIINYRTLQKCLGKLGEMMVYSREGRLFPDYMQIGAPTGRMAARKPATQNIPTIIKGLMIVPEPGRAIVRIDYPAIELRLAAVIAPEPVFIEVLREQGDLHKRTASIIMDKPEVEISKGERKQAKPVNFGFAYGMGAKRFRLNAKVEYGMDITLEQAISFKNKFLSGYSGLDNWQKKAAKRLEASGIIGNPKDFKNRKYVGFTTSTLYGRKMRVAQYSSALNFPVQGSGADLLKDACIRAARIFRENGLELKIVCLIHDEIIIETAEADKEKAAALLAEAMESAANEMIRQFETIVKPTIITRSGDVVTIDDRDENNVETVDLATYDPLDAAGMDDLRKCAYDDSHEEDDKPTTKEADEIDDDAETGDTCGENDQAQFET